MSEKPNPIHEHQPGDRYRAVFGDFFGNPDSGYSHEYSWLGPVRTQHRAAERDGFKAQHSDDFNIGVIRGGELVALLWMWEVIDDEPDVLADVVESAGVASDV
jgi:hypothetical protein